MERPPRLLPTALSHDAPAGYRGSAGTACPTDAADPTSDPSARPMRADARRNRSRVLAAAREAFAQDGAGVPVEEIARRAGVGKATVYRYYPTKDALFEAAVFEPMEALRNRAVELLCGGDPEAFFTCLVEMVEMGAADRALIDALSDTGSGIESVCTEMYEQLIERMAELLRVAQEANLVRRDVRAVDLKPLIVGLLAAHAAAGNESSCKWLVDVACYGLRTGRST